MIGVLRRLCSNPIGRDRNLNALNVLLNVPVRDKKYFSLKIRPKLVLHFDVNETIMVGDPAGGDSFEQSLNKIVSKQAYVYPPKDDDLPDRWHDLTPIHPTVKPPDLHTSFERPVDPISQQPYESFYRLDSIPQTMKQNFTEPGFPGEAYRYKYEELLHALRWPEGKPADYRLCLDKQHHFLLPAFYHTLNGLIRDNRSCTIVIRTFGHDVFDVMRAIRAFIDNAHLEHLQLPVDGRTIGVAPHTWEGSYTEDGSWLMVDGMQELTSEDDVVAALEANDEYDISIVAVRDDYHHWKRNDFRPSAGKPVWVTHSDHEVHHIFFDDNIHNEEDDSIVALRARSTPDHPFEAMDGRTTIANQGVHLVRVPAVEPILNINWFLERIRECEEARAERR